MILRPVATFALLLLAAAAIAACRETSAPADVFIRIDNQSLSLADFRRDFAQLIPPGQELGAAEKDELQRSLVARSIDRLLAAAEAKRLGLSVSDAEVETAVEEHRRDYPAGRFEENLASRRISLEEWKEELRERLLLEKLARSVAGDKATVSESEISAYYRQNKDEFDRPAQVRARQIVVADAAAGEKVLALLQQKKKTFVEAAREYSLSPDGEMGGDLGFFARGEMPAEFDAVVFNLPIGRLSPLVKSEYGYHIFLVDEKRDAVHLSLEQARNEIRDKLRSEREERLYQKWLEELRAKAKIFVDWQLLDKP